MPREVEIIVNRSDFKRLVAPLIGLSVNWPWRGYGSAIFLELGVLRRVLRKSGRGHRIDGEARIGIEWDWRVENACWIEFGSTSYDIELDAGLKTHQRRRIEAITIRGRVPEITIAFDDNRLLQSFMTNPGRPMWCVYLPDGSYIGIDEKSGDVVRKSEL